MAEGCDNGKPNCRANLLMEFYVSNFMIKFAYLMTETSPITIELRFQSKLLNFLELLD